MNERTEQVPLSALRFDADAEFGESKEGDKSSPFSMVARTGRAVAHPYWGSVVHDFSGMRTPGNRERVAIDFNHDANIIIGYANRLKTETGDLIAKGALTPTDFNQKATEIIGLARQGVPFQASISFGGGDGLKVERLEEGQVAEVNGTEFSGPGSIIREWTLTGIAVTPAGHDSNTSVEFNKQETTRITIMSQDKETPKVEEESVDTKQAELKKQEPVVEVTKTVEAADGAFSVKTRDQLIEAFGEQQGSIYFAQGKTFTEALAADNKAMREELAGMKSQLSAAKTEGEETPVGPSTKPDEQKKEDGDVEEFSGIFSDMLGKRQ